MSETEFLSNHERRFPGRTALVTGGGAGIGYGITRHLLGAGLNVQILDYDQGVIDAAIGELEGSGGFKGRVSASRGSVTSADDIVTGFDAAEAQFGGPVQMLVNNAGGGIEVCLLKDITEELWDAVVDLNLKGTFLCLREFARRLLDAGLPGSAVNLSSLNYEAATDGLGPYCAAKAGVSQLTKVCAAEWSRFGIRTNAVAPGSVETPKVKEVGLLDGRLGEEFMVRTPIGRFGVPDDIARTIAFLLSEEASWITGVTLGVDGGQGVRGLPSYWDVLNEAPAGAEA
jgi:3-oxoacyl-[acyl-carrier protein] reductase